MNNNLPEILVVDDESFMAGLLAKMLHNLGYPAVTVSDNGQAALQSMAGTARPDLILLDLNMPGMDGIEFLRHLVELRFSGALILISGEEERLLESAEKLADAHGITTLGHVCKPPSPESLVRLLHNFGLRPPSEDNPARRTYAAAEVAVGIAGGELVNYYQPKVAIDSAHVVGVEALVRWKHPHDGIVYPDQFIEVAETHGLIDELTHVVVKNALVQAGEWKRQGLQLSVAINISTDNLASPDFVDFMTAQAVAAGVPPGSIVLEITESRLIRDLRAPLEALTRLRLRGFRLSIDDFGTGHSTLTQLRDLPFDQLKIDQGFVRGAGTSDTLCAMFETSLTLAKRLGLECVAEGVETAADWEFVRNSDCDLGQGYFIARPMPAEEIPSWIRSWHAGAGKVLHIPATE